MDTATRVEMTLAIMALIDAYEFPGRSRKAARYAALDALHAFGAAPEAFAILREMIEDAEEED
jgi:hypothetical protein